MEAGILDMAGWNLPSILLVGLFMLMGTVASALINNGYLSRIFKGKGKGKPLDELIKHADKMESMMDMLSKQMDKMDRRLNYVDKSALMGVIYNSAISKIDRMRAFNCYMKLGGNGLVFDYAVNELVLPNWEEWMRVVQESRMDIVCDNYNNRIAEINALKMKQNNPT